MKIAQTPTRYLFYTGKGGVGKTSISSATAIALADKGRRVLLVSTDPASNLDEVLGVKLGSSPTAVPGVPRLDAMNLDPEVAATEYRERRVGPYRGVLPEATVRELLPRLRDPEFTRILLVTLPEATPVHEAARLQVDLKRAQITPFAWVINQALTPVETSDPVLLCRKTSESGYIDEVTKRLAGRATMIPWLADPPTEDAGLQACLGKKAGS